MSDKLCDNHKTSANNVPRETLVKEMAIAKHELDLELEWFRSMLGVNGKAEPKAKPDLWRFYVCSIGFVACLLLVVKILIEGLS